MNFYLIASLAFFMLSLVCGKVYLPELYKKHGSLYQGIRLLILSEKYNAELTWNDTKRQIDENSGTLHKALDYMHNYETIINKKLNEINSLEHSAEVKKCYKQYEQQIARFNRHLLENYNVCKQTLNTSLSQLKNEVMQEIQYIHDAAAQIQELVYVCNVTDLKRIDRESHHASVTLCVLSNLGEINQHILEAVQVSLNILARVYQEDNEQFEVTQRKPMHICVNFHYLRDELETIYENVMLCVGKID